MFTPRLFNTTYPSRNTFNTTASEAWIRTNKSPVTSPLRTSSSNHCL